MRRRRDAGVPAGAGPRLVVPETIQTSGMDCGPAALRSLLAGFGIDADYGSLREACRTDIDGTSIDALADAARSLGLAAAQVMIPADHVLLGAPAGALPALAVVRLANGMPHFVILWRRHGGLVQVMDPGTGRRLVRAARAQADLYLHTQPVPAEAFARYSAGAAFRAGLRHRCSALGLADAEEHVARAGEDGWEGTATLDAAVRAVARTGARGEQAARAVAELRLDPPAIPADAWFARPADHGLVTLQGAVLLRARGRSETPPDLEALTPELRAALTVAPRPPARLLLDAARAGGPVPARTLAGVSVAVGASVVVEATLLRTALTTPGTGGALAAVAAVAALVLAIELAAARARLAVGRRLDLGLRTALAAAAARLPDRYVRSRPGSDLAERAHALQELRALPTLAGEAVAAAAGLVAVTVGLCALDPRSAPLAIAAAAVVVGMTLLAQPLLREVELRRREHGVALAQLELDAVLGSHPIRAVRGGPALAAEHGARVSAWRAATASAARARAIVAMVQTAVALALAVPLVLAALPRLDGPANRLLFVLWATGIPLTAERLSVVALRWPLLRVLALRLAEPLGAASEEAHPGGAVHASPPAPARGVEIAVEGVRLAAAGRPVLNGIDLTIAAGEHVAVVGASGSGKSTLLNLVLGVVTPTEGTVRVDGVVLDAATTPANWASTAWVSPDVRLWNAPLAVNLGGTAAAERALEGVELSGVATRLGEDAIGDDGGRLSGGEGQRLRLARALAQEGVRLALLDEALRGLDRGQRARLLAVARRRWREATLICATHDLGAAAEFDRVLVLDAGRIVEDGPPAVLAADPGSRFSALLAAERALRADLDGGEGWRRVRLEAGRLAADDGAGAPGDARPRAAPVGATGGAPERRRPGALAWRIGVDLLIHLARAAALVASWVIIGDAVLDGEVGADRLWPWIAVLAASIPIVGAAAWFEAGTSATLAERLRHRLFAGALAVDPGQVKAEGPGRTLGRIYELEPAATVAATGALGVLLGAVEVAAAGVVLTAIELGRPAALVLALIVAALLVAGAAHRRRFRAWADLRVAATQRLLERLVGHRTALVQGTPVDLLAGLEDYDRRARRAERGAVLLAEVLPRLWLVVGSAALGLAAAGGPPDLAALAAGAGGLLLAANGMKRAGEALVELDAAVVGVTQLRPLLADPPAPELRAPAGAGEAVGAERLSVRRDGSEVLAGVSLSVRRRERVLLTGPSGSGKSTLAEALCGLRPASDGEVRGGATLVPQFHDEHLVLAPLAFNLLLGRAWPPEEADLVAAAEVCEELGLGPLLARMPAGMAQVVGETGWQLSNGERTLVGLARTLLSGPEAIVLDESLGPLDPDAARRALAVVRDRVPTVVVISQE